MRDRPEASGASHEVEILLLKFISFIKTFKEKQPVEVQLKARALNEVTSEC